MVFVHMKTYKNQEMTEKPYSPPSLLSSFRWPCPMLRSRGLPPGNGRIPWHSRPSRLAAVQPAWAHGTSDTQHGKLLSVPPTLQIDVQWNVFKYIYWNVCCMIMSKCIHMCDYLCSYQLTYVNLHLQSGLCTRKLCSGRGGSLLRLGDWQWFFIHYYLQLIHHC